jgi:4-hydroxy-tetrahydrodipicolinate synthase
MHIDGVCSALPTPFTAGGDIDHPSLGRVTDLAIAGGVSGVVVLGVAGEAARVAERERAAAIETVVKAAAGRVRVIAGASADGVRLAIEYCREAQARGASAVLIGAPRLARFSSEAVVNHFRSIAEAVDLPIVIQDYPPACGYNVESGLLARIAREVPAARTIALDDPPTPFKIARILAAAGETRVSVLGGLGGSFLLEELMAGAAGVIAGTAFPAALVRVVDHHRAGRLDRAAELFYRLLPLLRFEAQDGVGAAIRKELFRRRGVLTDASTRAPGARLDDATRAALDRLLAWTAAQEETGWILQ